MKKWNEMHDAYELDSCYNLIRLYIDIIRLFLIDIADDYFQFMNAL